MNRNLFPTYNVDNLKDSIFIEVNGSNAELHKLSLDSLAIITGKKFIDEETARINITFGTKEFLFQGRIVHFKYLRELKKYSYKIDLEFNEKRQFLMWLAIIKGLHKARFSC